MPGADSLGKKFMEEVPGQAGNGLFHYCAGRRDRHGVKMPPRMAGDLCADAERAEDDQDVFDLGHRHVSVMGHRGDAAAIGISALPGNAVSRGDPARCGLIGFVTAGLGLRVRPGMRRRGCAGLLLLSRRLLVTLDVILRIILCNRRQRPGKRVGGRDGRIGGKHQSAGLGGLGGRGNQKQDGYQDQFAHRRFSMFDAKISSMTGP
jgi:hypothetical protein